MRVSGHCFWEKTSNGCKNDDDTFKHNAYDFYALCRSGNNKHAEFQCKEEPAKLSARKCRDDAAKKGHGANILAGECSNNQTNFGVDVNFDPSY